MATNVHDRRTTDVLINSQLVAVEVDDPLEPGSRLMLMGSVRDDPLRRLFDRKQIDEAQFNAGRKMQALYERAEIGGVQAIDFTKEPVDGGGIRDTLTETTQRAISDLARIELLLGREGADLARDLLCRGHSVKVCAEMRMGGAASERYHKYLGARFREVLETLAIDFGLVTNRGGA